MGGGCRLSFQGSVGERKAKALEVLRDKRKRKVGFLSQKYGRKDVDCVTEVKGITVADQTIPPSFSSSPQCYGGVDLTSDEKKALCLPPKFAAYDQVDLTSCEAQIEKGLAKLRWSMIRKTDSTPDEGEEEEERVWPFDLETKAFDLRSLRPTDIPFNIRVCLPDALDSDKEIDMQHLKGKLVRATREYISDQNVRSTKSNLTSEEQ